MPWIQQQDGRNLLTDAAGKILLTANTDGSIDFHNGNVAPVGKLHVTKTGELEISTDNGKTFTGFNKKGNIGTAVAVAAAATTATVNFGTAQPDTNYVVAITPAWGTTYSISKTVNGFTVTFGTASPTGGSTFDWALQR